MSPRIWSKDCGVARRCKLFIGTELERGTLVLEGLFVWPPLERRRELAAANLQGSYLEREHNARWAALGVAHATMSASETRGSDLIQRTLDNSKYLSYYNRTQMAYLCCYSRT